MFGALYKISGYCDKESFHSIIGTIEKELGFVLNKKERDKLMHSYTQRDIYVGIWEKCIMLSISKTEEYLTDKNKKIDYYFIISPDSGIAIIKNEGKDTNRKRNSNSNYIYEKYDSIQELKQMVLDVLSELRSGDQKQILLLKTRMYEFEKILVSGKASREMNLQINQFKREVTIYIEKYRRINRIMQCVSMEKIFSSEYYFLQEQNICQEFEEELNFLMDLVVAQRELYNAVIDLNLNETMKFFTLVATIFMPITLITGWYGMNFKYMPELLWNYGYLYVIFLSIGITGMTWYYFRKRHRI